MVALTPSIAALLLAIHAVGGHGHLGGSAHAHRRMHQHHARNGEATIATAVTQIVPGPTVVVYEYSNKQVPINEVCEGIKNGTFLWTEGNKDAPDCRAYGLDLNEASSTGDATAAATAAATATAAISAKVATEEAAASTHATSSAEAPSTTEAPSTSQPTNENAGGSGGGTTAQSGYDRQIAYNANVGKEFPDGEIDCSTFPSAYGAVPVNWIGLGGWSGIQYTVVNNNVVTHIDTAVQGNSCQSPGSDAVAFCSYACPPGFQKSQWPSTQGSASMAVSVGGIMCGADNKLHLTNPGLSRSLCIAGTGSVTIKNHLSASNAICRTDYPGTESETVPLVIQTNSEAPLTVPDSSTYYKHLGSATTAEYYVNMKGVPVNEACIWGSDGSYEGNWAPTVFGAGMDQNGKTWLSIQSTIQNAPSSYKNLDFTVELEGDFGGSKCFYTNGYYCTKGSPANFNPSDCQTISTTAVPGCTVELMSGNATYVLTD